MSPYAVTTGLAVWAGALSVSDTSPALPTGGDQNGQMTEFSEKRFGVM